MAVGFKTKAVREAEAKALAEANNSPQLENEQMMDVSPVVAETINRIEQLNNFICSKDFETLPKDRKQMVLNDLMYITQVSTYII